MIIKKLKTIEKLINSELSSKIQNSSINHNELMVEIDENDLIDVVQFLKSNENFKFNSIHIKNFPFHPISRWENFCYRIYSLI